jgi:hypothetical protein
MSTKSLYNQTFILSTNTNDNSCLYSINIECNNGNSVRNFGGQTQTKKYSKNFFRQNQVDCFCTLDSVGDSGWVLFHKTKLVTITVYKFKRLRPPNVKRKN